MKRILTAWIALLFLGSLSATAFAHEVPDLDENGTITLIMDWNGEMLDSGSLSMFRVGEIMKEDGNYSFALIEQMQSRKTPLENLDDPALAAELANLAKEEKLAEISTPIVNGKAVFTDLTPGLYVVVQEEADASDGFGAISPFLISMPNYENGTYTTQVTAEPKVPLEPTPTEEPEPEPTQPDDPKLPQTGQVNWPVPLLAVSGMILFAAGWRLCFGRNKENYEE